MGYHLLNQRLKERRVLPYFRQSDYLAKRLGQTVLEWFEPELSLKKSTLEDFLYGKRGSALTRSSDACRVLLADFFQNYCQSFIKRSWAAGSPRLRRGVVYAFVIALVATVWTVRRLEYNYVEAKLQSHNNYTEMDMPSPKPKKRKRPESLPLLEQSGNNSEEVGSDVLEGSKPELSLEEVKTIEDFHIMVKGVCIDSELPDDVRMNYYKLCTARKELLHDELAEGLYHKLVAGMIGETVNIANKIKNCQITTTKGEFETWDNHLKSFVIMGMKVKFLRERIATLSKIVLESEANLDVQKYVEAKGEHKRVEDDIQSLTEKLVGLKESSRKSKRIVDGLKEKIEVHEEKLQKQVDAFKIV
ncbi:DNA-binding pseudobarrel domain-containing protein [Artemisia annua]|uniref:DNA-binding pseudobarrel domain-containing protein n=1 Tax=Artemisia annua TaxID=35608 RepID=A0A2U1P460_ARTAN|nr:DNA-binding pseudobarrel domain-containing protein [Artemisia annua]